MLNPSERLECSLTIRKGLKTQDGHQFQQQQILYNSISIGKQFSAVNITENKLFQL